MPRRKPVVGEYRIIEFAGWDREKDIGAAFDSIKAAWDYVSAHYDPDEVESLGVDVGRVDTDGQITYDF